MSDHLILDWDSKQVRLLSCSSSSNVLNVRQALSADLDEEVSAASLIGALSPLVNQVGGSRLKAVIVLGGRDIQSRLLRVPPVPAVELPDMVRLRANTEFSTSDETAVVDFVPLKQSAEEPSTVFVARAAENRLELARQVSGKLQISLQHLATRGAGITALATRALESLKTGTHLVAACRGDEVDLVGICESQVASVRSVPLPPEGDLDTQASAVAREFRRTIAALASELDTPNIESIVWLASDEQDGELADRCGKELSRTITKLELSKLSVLQFDESVEQISQYAALIGTGMAEDQHAIDFLSPREAPKAEKPVRTYVLAASFGLLMLLSGAWLIYNSVASVEAKAEANRQQINELRKELDGMSDEMKQHKLVEEWLATDVNWLDEIDHIAVTVRPKRLDDHEAFDEERDVKLTRINARQAPGRNGVGGIIELDGLVRDDNVVEDFEQQLRGPGRKVDPKGILKNPEEKPYIWTFKDDIVVAPEQGGRS